MYDKIKLEISPYESPEILEATADYFQALAEIGRKDEPASDLHSAPEKTSSEVLKFLQSWLPGMAKMLSMQKIDKEEMHTYKDGWSPDGPEEFKKAGQEMREHLQSMAPQFTHSEIQESETNLPVGSLEQCRARYESDKAKESAEQVFSNSTPTLPKLSFGLVDGKVELKGANNFPATVGLVAPHPVPAHQELDINGVPYDERIHSRGKSKLADGSWRIRRGVSDEQAREVEKEILGHDIQLSCGKPPKNIGYKESYTKSDAEKIKIVSQTGVTEKSSDLTPPPPPPPSDDTEELDAFDAMMDYVNDARKAGRITVAQIQEIAASIPGAVNMLNLSKPKNAHLVPEMHAAFVKVLEGK